MWICKPTYINIIDDLKKTNGMDNETKARIDALIKNQVNFMNTHSAELQHNMELARAESKANEERQKRVAAKAKALYERKPAKTSEYTVGKINHEYERNAFSCMHYRFDYKGEVIYMAALVLAKGTAARKPDIRLAFTKKHPKDEANKKIAKKISTERVLKVEYNTSSSNGVSNTMLEAGFSIPLEIKRRIANTIHELLCQYDPPAYELHKEYEEGNKGAAFNNFVPENMLRLVRLVMPEITRNKIMVDYIAETQADSVKYIRK